MTTRLFNLPQMRRCAWTLAFAICASVAILNNFTVSNFVEMSHSWNAESRRGFLRKVSAFSVYGGLMMPAGAAGHTTGQPEPAVPANLTSLPPDRLFEVLDLDMPGLEKVKQALARKGKKEPLAELLKYYLSRYPAAKESAKSDPGKIQKALERAANLEKNTFQWGPYLAAAYGKNIDWAYDPAKDIEWVAAVYRFFWASDLVEAYQHTKDDRYAATFVRLANDWIDKHPLPATLSDVHPVYTHWKGYAWLDLQTGIRATNICMAFRALVTSPSFTPEFVGKLMASLYDHQQKTLLMPMNKIHNKAVFEQRGFVNVIYTFPEFKGKQEWLAKSMEITYSNLVAQTTTDGVQREWCGGYHHGVYHDFMEIESRYREAGFPVPEKYMDRTRKMADYMFYIATPELGFPMFGDTARPLSTKREKSGLGSSFLEAGKRFNDPKYAALAEGRWDLLPVNGSAAFKTAGFYVFRNNWKPEQVYMALHCSPQSINPFHDQQDNGTFELAAYGRWLMPDTGFYIYGHSSEDRNWHRKTHRHATLTVDRKDTNVAGQFLKWESGPNQDMVCVENQSYTPSLLHRRTIWFAAKESKPFFVILDEAIGDTAGNLEIHFPMAPGEIDLNKSDHSICTRFPDANLLIRVYGKAPIELTQEAGWTSDQYGKRTERPVVSASYKGMAPFSFVSILVPFKGTSAPSCRLLTDPGSLTAGDDPVELRVEAGGKEYSVSRKIADS